MKCPGQDSRFWKPGDIFEIGCPRCGSPVEFFKDEPTLRCKKCGHKIVNPKTDFGCAATCKYADQCLGELPPELFARRKEILKDRVAAAVKRFFKQNFKQIGHAVKVARFAEEIAREEGGDLAVVLSAAYLHDVGVRGAGSPEEEGAGIAREILEDLGAPTEMIDEVCDIIRHHHYPREQETPNFRAVYDGDQIANLAKKLESSPMSREDLAAVIDRSFLTGGGRRLARKVLFQAQGQEA